MIQINKGIVKEWNEQNPSKLEVFDVSEDRLNEVLALVNKQYDPIAQTSYLLAGIAWAQPFSGGNKRTAFTCADTLLRMSGYTIEMSGQIDIDYLRSLLLEIQESRSGLDEFTLAKIILYVAKRLKKI